MDNQVGALRQIMHLTNGWPTCSIFNPVPYHITWARESGYLLHIDSMKDSVIVFVPKSLEESLREQGYRVIGVNDVQYVFTLYHNEVNLRSSPKQNIISELANLHPTVFIGEDGLKFVKGPRGSQLRFRHMGNVVIEPMVRIGPYCVVHRACLDSTIIRSGVIIGSLCNIGHNTEIGRDSILTAHISTGGGSVIGERCWLGMGVMVTNKVSICDDVRIGIGSVVTKSITKPGVYYGVPARCKGEWNGEWYSD